MSVSLQFVLPPKSLDTLIFVDILYLLCMLIHQVDNRAIRHSRICRQAYLASA